MIRKYLLLTLGALAASSVALAVPIHQSQDPAGLNSDGMYQKNIQRIERATQMAESLKTVSTRALPSTPVIRNPEGTYKYYTKNMSGYYQTETAYEYFKKESAAATIVFGENNDVYIQDPLTLWNGEGCYKNYLKGELSNNDIIVTLPQTISDDYLYIGYAADLAVMEKQGDEYVISDVNEIKYKYDAGTGGYTLEMPGDNYILGYVFAINGAWLEDAVISEVYTPFDGVNSLPEGLEENVYMYKETDAGFPVHMSKDSENLYIRGLSPNFPYGVVKGSIDGNNVTISQNQIIASAFGEWVTTKVIATNTGVAAPAATGYTMTADWSTNVFTGSNDKYTLGLLAGSVRDPEYYEYFNNFQIYIQESFAGTPANPLGIAVNTEVIDLGIYVVAVEIPTVSTDNTVLLANNLYYRIFVDGDLYEFEADEAEGIYEGIEGTMTDIPFNFTNGSDIIAWSYNIRTINFYLSGVSTFGVQTVYKYEGTETVSDIITTAVPEDSGVEEIENATVLNERFYDLNGREVVNPEKGIFIRSLKLSNGKTETSKVIKK